MNTGPKRNSCLRLLWLAFIGLVSRTGAEVVTFSYNSSDAVPVTAGHYAAAGHTLALSLNHRPISGTSLTVVKNTGRDFMDGSFDNLTQGQELALSHNGIEYHFVADYYGGDGNDLVLQWADTRLVAWGYNAHGQLGTLPKVNPAVPNPVEDSGVLAGKTVTALATGFYHSLALGVDATVAAWGSNRGGWLGNGEDTNHSPPVAVGFSGALKDRMVISLAAGQIHSLALCSDGTVVSWGWDDDGQLGTARGGDSNIPVEVDRSGVLAGKRVIAVAAGHSHSLALCLDGTVAAWGNNKSGQLGIGSTAFTYLPAAVNLSGVLDGKTVIAVAAGEEHSLVLCSDGTMAAWGNNKYGQLGNGGTVSSMVPVLVNRTGVLSGRTVTTLAVGGNHNLVLCSDGALAAWGANQSGQLGIGNTTQRSSPVAVNAVGALAAKIISAIAAGRQNSRALCRDGGLIVWGDGSNLPTALNLSQLPAGERLVAVTSGPASLHTLAVSASGPAPGVITGNPVGLSATRVVLHGLVSANRNRTTVEFEYGLTTAYGMTAGASPAEVEGRGYVAAEVAVVGLAPATTYHYRIKALNAAGTTEGVDRTFTTLSTVATLSGLALNSGNLEPAFDPGIHHYTAALNGGAVFVTPTVTHGPAVISINGTLAASGKAAPAVLLEPGENAIHIAVTAEDGITTLNYQIIITATPVPVLQVVFQEDTEAAVTMDRYTAAGNEVAIQLDHAPDVGSRLTVVQNTGPVFILGTFRNLAQGQEVLLAYGGITYRFVANYYGGDGNDLVLQWANNRLAAWGWNYQGQLGDGTQQSSRIPQAVTGTGILAGKTITAVAAAFNRSLALCHDGTLVEWGQQNFSSWPVAVPPWTGFGGRLIVAMTCGQYFASALCSDGTVLAWGNNSQGQLGDGTTSGRTWAAPVSSAGALAGKTVTLIVSGAEHTLALCSDGTLAAWGANTYGALGNGGTGSGILPVAVKRTGVLAGKDIIAMAAGFQHSLALCSDGTIAAWGRNLRGQLGNGSLTDSGEPVEVRRGGVLGGRRVIAISAGREHSLGLCEDGTLAAWGSNEAGQLGNGTNQNASEPVAVDQSGVLIGKTITRISAVGNHSMAVGSDGSLAAWGNNYNGELGNGGTASAHSRPVLVDPAGMAAGERFTATAVSADASHSLTIVSSGSAPGVVTLPATEVTDTSAVLHGTVDANDSSAAVFFDFGTTPAFGQMREALPAVMTGSSATPASAVVAGLLPATLYYYRINGTSAAATTPGPSRTFTTRSALQQWRLVWFGYTANASSAADLNDFDRDGLVNLVEFAFGQDPSDPGSALLPAFEVAGNQLVLGFTQPAGVSGISYGAEWSPSLLPESWTPVPDTGSGATHRFSVEIDSYPRKYLRLKVQPD